MKVLRNCALCGCAYWRESGAVNRSERRGLPLYCGRKCAGLARRSLAQPEERKEAKRLYDIALRNGARRDELLAKKRAAYRRDFDPAKHAAYRKKRMPKHVEYCRQPAYRVKKSAYDEVRRDRLTYGEFAEAAKLLRSVETEVAARATRVEIAIANGTLNKAQERKRALL